MGAGKEGLKAGLELTWKRHITEADIEGFAALSGDRGAHHLQRDGQGRLMAHGLLTATLPTKLGGDLDFMARTMRFDFQRPVYSGDILTCKGTVASVVRQTRRLKVRFLFEIVNQRAEVVLKGESQGQILI